MKELPNEDVDRLRAAQGGRVDRYIRASATEVIAAFDAFSAAGLVAGAGNHHFVNEARRVVAEGAT